MADGHRRSHASDCRRSRHTHLDVHVTAAIDPIGGLLGVESFPTTPAGYHALASWLGAFGPVDRVGVEGTGTYGAGLARHLAAAVDDGTQHGHGSGWRG